ncbi:CopG family transcriptional regulator [Streptomyces kebangsaanensis]|uniref:CopG family transcriptional regulator n=1 Tax=Streptomyces kebangsaanensis TaxID=864058 RepID=A0ABW6KK17_9ACTN
MSLKRTTVYLEDEDLRDLKTTASRKGISEAELIREGVRLAIARNRVWDEPVGLPVFDSGDPAFAERADDILRDTRFGDWSQDS